MIVLRSIDGPKLLVSPCVCTPHLVQILRSFVIGPYTGEIVATKYADVCTYLSKGLPPRGHAASRRRTIIAPLTPLHRPPTALLFIHILFLHAPPRQVRRRRSSRSRWTNIISSSTSTSTSTSSGGGRYIGRPNATTRGAGGIKPPVGFIAALRGGGGGDGRGGVVCPALGGLATGDSAREAVLGWVVREVGG